jgi:hypothetical protein
MMEASRRRLFEHDRRMELKMRIAATKMGEESDQPQVIFKSGAIKPEAIGRLIKRVRQL